MSVIISVYSYQTSLSFLSGQKNLFRPTLCMAFTLTDSSSAYSILSGKPFFIISSNAGLSNMFFLEDIHWL